MSFELRIDEALPDGIHRIAKKEIEKVRECVDGLSKASRDEMVHEARKSLKKLRALVRLVRPGVGGKLYRRENFAFRDIARPLTEVRDARILVEALDRTTGGNGHRPGRRSFAKARGELVRHQREIRQKVMGDEEAFEGVDSAMKKALDRLDKWTDFHDGWSSARRCGWGERSSKKRRMRSCDGCAPTGRIFTQARARRAICRRMERVIVTLLRMETFRRALPPRNRCPPRYMSRPIAYSKILGP